MDARIHSAAAVLVSVLILVLILVAVLIAVLTIVLVAVLIVILVLIAHRNDPPIYIYGLAAKIACPDFQDLSFALKNKLAKSPLKMAAAMPPAEAFRPPVKIPRNPFS